MNIPNHIGKSPEEILTFSSCDSASYLYRSMAWLNYHERTQLYTSFLYACAEARQGIEYLLFEELVISTGANLTLDEYKKCVNERNRFIKTIKQLSPDYELLQEFSKILVSLDPAYPKLVYWDHSSLMRAWGEISSYLHWSGARSLTAENSSWVGLAFSNVKSIINPIWIKITSGQSGLMHPNDMVPIVHEIWIKFRNREINSDNAKFQLNYLKPLAKLKTPYTIGPQN